MRPWAPGRTADPLVEAVAPGWISPLAVETLFVNEDMAQPVQVEASPAAGVPMRGVVVWEVDVLLLVVVGVEVVSGRVWANLRIRARYWV